MNDEEIDQSRLSEALRTRLDQGKKEHRAAVRNFAQASRTVPPATDAVQAALVALLVARARLALLFLEADEQAGLPVSERQGLLDAHVESIVEIEEILLDMKWQA
jgi:hypothetical protein